MRTVGILVWLGLVVGAVSGCKNKSEAGAAPADPAAIKAQQELVARRDALLAQREKLQGESTKIQEEIVKTQANGGDVTELTKKKQELDSQIEMQDSNLTNTSSELNALSNKLDAAGGVAAREAKVAEREAKVAEREKLAMAQMQKLMDLETKNAEKWKESCGGGGQMIIQQVAPPKGGNYTRKEVDALVGRAKSAMAKKGILSSDLGPQASLEGEVTKALQDSDWTRGYILASQLVQTIDGITLNRPFVKAKYERLQSRVARAKVDEATNQQLVSGLQEISKTFGDGDFAAANRRINQLHNLIK